jgi:hypothetical protein
MCLALLNRVRRWRGSGVHGREHGAAAGKRYGARGLVGADDTGGRRADWCVVMAA